MPTEMSAALMHGLAILIVAGQKSNKPQVAEAVAWLQEVENHVHAGGQVLLVMPKVKAGKRGQS